MRNPLNTIGKLCSRCGDQPRAALPGAGLAPPDQNPTWPRRRSHRRLQSIALATLLLAEIAFPVLPPLVAVSCITTEAQARSSGGYSRPGFSGSRTPSFGGFRATPRTPSFSGGYSRPGSKGFPTSRRPSVSSSAGDRAFSRERSGEALRDYRATQSGATPRPNSTGGGHWWGTGSDGRSRGTYQRNRADRVVSPTRLDRPELCLEWAAAFGVWDGLFLWFLLSHLSRAWFG